MKLHAIRRPGAALVLALSLSVLLVGQPTARAADDDSLFNSAMTQDPGASESPSKGKTSVFNEGEGEPPASGYFKKHEPGEIAEYHLFVPDKLEKQRLYPLLIVYHGGKDGASGKGTLRGYIKVSTKEHPVIVLSPNMYTMDAYNELMEKGDVPIDPNRVVVFGFSSGGMGVLSAMKEFGRSKGAFKPATLIAASTTASMGPGDYPPCPYIVMAGERETPEFVKNNILKNRRSTCRKHAVAMQQVFDEVRYLEMQGFGHTAGKPAHIAAIRNLIRALPDSAVKLKAGKTPDELQPLVRAARGADWGAVHSEITRLDAAEEWATRSTYKTLRSRVLKAMDATFKSDAKFVAGIGKKSKTWEILRAFELYDRLEPVPSLFTGTPAGEKLVKYFASIEGSKHWQAELAARKRYQEIVADPASDALVEKLEGLRAESPATEFGGNRTREKLLALKG